MIFKITITLFIIVVSIFSETGYKNKKEIFSSLFPSSKITQVNSFLGKGDSCTIQLIPNIRKLQGVINLNDAFVKPFNDNIYLVAFQVFLCDKQIDMKSLIKDQIKENPNNSKTLIQLVVYDYSQKKIIAKPEKYPEIANDWICMGDFCDIKELVDVSIVDKSSFGFYVKVSKGIENKFIQVFSLDGSTLKESELIQYGELGGNSGCEITREIESVIYEKQIIYINYSTFCDPGCEDICKRFKIETGDKKVKYPILQLKN